MLHPWAIAVGLLAASLPVLIHWLTRPKPARLPLSTLRFVRDLVAERRAFWRLRDALVLLLRTAAIGLLAAAIARPFFGEVRATQPSERGQDVRIVIVDASQSMAARLGNTELFERARPVAAKQLGYEPGLSANLILAAAKPSAVFARASNNFSALGEALSKSRPLPQRLRAQEAINLAADMLAATPGAGAKRELVVISDFQRTNWGSVDFASLPGDTQIRLESVAPDTTLSNLAVLDVATLGRAEVGHELRLNVAVGNFSPALRHARLQVDFGSTVTQIEGDLPPNARTVLSAEIIAREPGWHTGVARLLDVEDALAEDNSRPFAIDVRPPPLLALVTRQSADAIPSSSYFVERALSPYEAQERRSAMRIVRLRPEAIDRETLSSAESIIIDHPGKLPAVAIQLLASFFHRGRGILYLASEPTDATNLKLLSDAIGGGFRLPVEFIPSTRRPRRNLAIAEARKDQSPFALFGDQLPSYLEELRFSGGLATNPQPGSIAEEVLSRFDDQSAFLVAAESDASTFAVINADLGQSNLPSSPMFVPMLGELVQRRLSGRAGHVEAVLSGEPFSIALPPDIEGAAGLAISGPQSAASENDRGELVGDAQGVLWHSESAGRPGSYEVRRDGKTLFAAPILLAAEESDLRTIGADVFKERLSGGRNVEFHSALGDQTQEQDNLWIWLVIGCVGCVLLEIATLAWFRT
jgi:hypothetical protein